MSVLDVANRNTWDLRPWARKPAMAPDGRVMVNGIGGGKDSLYTVDLGGANERQAGAHPEDSYASWSPSGVSVTFHSSFEGDHQDRIYVQKDASHVEEPAAWRSARRRFSASIRRGWRTGALPLPAATTGIAAAIAASGAGQQQQRQSGAGDRQPRRHQHRQRRGDPALCVAAERQLGSLCLPANGGTPRNLTNSPSHDFGAAFSPDGRTIAFMSNRDGWGIWVMNADGSNPQKLISVPGFGSNWKEERLAWGP